MCSSTTTTGSGRAPLPPPSRERERLSLSPRRRRHADHLGWHGAVVVVVVVAVAVGVGTAADAASVAVGIGLIIMRKGRRLSNELKAQTFLSLFSPSNHAGSGAVVRRGKGCAPSCPFLKASLSLSGSSLQRPGWYGQRLCVCERG